MPDSSIFDASSKTVVPSLFCRFTSALAASNSLTMGSDPVLTAWSRGVSPSCRKCSHHIPFPGSTSQYPPARSHLPP